MELATVQGMVRELPARTVQVEKAIIRLRRMNVMVDSELARLYGVGVRTLNQAVKRHRDRFPSDFMFQLTTEELAFLRSQSVILETGRGRHRKYAPYAFTEQGVAMLSSVLRSPRAIAVNIEIMRAFVQLRRMLESHAELSAKIAALERRYDARFRTVFDAIRALMAPPKRSGIAIGFRTSVDTPKGG